MASSNALTTRFAADITQFERELKRLQRMNAQAANRLAADQAKAAKQAENAWNRGNFTQGMSRQIAGLGAEIKRLAPVIAGAFSVSAVAQAADQYTRYTNQLKVAGLAGMELKKVQEELFKIAQTNGVELESLGTLYGRAASSAQSLGASQEDLIKFTSTVSTALRVAGGDAQSASGALLQLSQVLGGGKVQAQEYNSLIDGLRPLLQAAASGSERFGGSVDKLTQAVKAGKVTSREFFEAILAGSEMLDTKAAAATTTLSQAFTVLSNAFMKYIGEANEATGVTAVFVEAIKALADNLPQVANALAIIGAIYAASFIPGIARATTAIVANSAAMVANAAVYNAASRSIMVGATAMNVARGAAGGLMGMLGGPLGIALTGITVAMGYYAIKSAEANAESARLEAAVEELSVKMGLQGESAVDAAIATGQVSSASVIAGANLNGLGIEVSRLTDKYYLLAAAARQAAYETAQQAVTDAKVKYNKRVAEETNDRTPGVVMFGGDPMDRKLGINTGRQVYRRDAEAALRNSPEARAVRRAEQLAAALRQPSAVDKFITRPGAAPATPGAPDKKTRGRGRSAAAKPEPSDGEEEIRQAEIDRLNLLLQEKTNLEERFEIQNEILKLEQEGRIAAINKRIADDQITQAAGDTLLEKEEQNQLLREQNLMAEQARERARREQAIQEKDVDLQAAKLRQEAEELEERSDLARTVAAKENYEWEALDRRQQADKLEFELAQKQYAADLRLLGLTEDKIAAMLAERQGQFDNRQSDERTDQSRDQRNDNPNVKEQIIDMAEGFGTLDAQLGEIASGALNDLTRGLTDAIMGAKSLKEAFGDMAKSIIAQLIEMAIRFVIFEAIGMALGIPGLGKASLGLGKTAKPSVDVGGNAMGTNNAQAGLSWVGEKGPELMYLPGGSQIAPNNLLRSALTQKMQNGAGGQVVNLFTTVNAQDAVLTDQVKSWIRESQIQSIQAATKMTTRDMNKRSANRLYR